jgi:DNA polymerase-3 subunit epsilon
MMLFGSPLARLKKRCEKALKDPAISEDLKPFYERPLPNPNDLIKDLKLTSIDFETTGLNFKEDVVLSMGGISFDNGAIDFATSFHQLLNVDPKKIKSNAAIINQITPEQLVNGMPPHQAFMKLMDKLSGGLVLTHCKVIESTFLRKSLGIPDKYPLPMVFLDTMAIEKSILIHQGNFKLENVRLNKIRERRGFPAYEAHNALADSLATAEVFLAQLHDIFGKKPYVLKDVYKRCE